MDQTGVGNKTQRDQKTRGRLDRSSLPAFAFKHARRFSSVMRKSTPAAYVPSIFGGGGADDEDPYGNRAILRKNYYANRKVSYEDR